MAQLVLTGIKKRFGTLEALKGIDLTVAPGELFTLLGPSGCGKTTLLRAIAGFGRQDEGSIQLGERRLDALPAHERNTGMVFQNYALFPHLTVAENVAFGLEQRRLPRAEIETKVGAAVATVRLEGLADRTPDQLSGGQQQRVGIARALVIEPDLLLMDEPLSNLDARLRVAMREELRAIQQAAGSTTIYVTHDQEEALAISDRIAVMNAGVVEQVGSPREVYHQPATTFVAEFVGRMNFLPPALLPDLAGEVAARIAIRPEALTVSAQGAESPAGLSGEVTRVTFLGAATQLTIAGPDGVSILAEHHDPTQVLEVGAAVSLAFPPDAIHRFDADGRRCP